MDEIEALNAEWEKIKSKGSAALEDALRGCSSSSSDATSSQQRRRKRSRWSDDKVSLDTPSNGCVYDPKGPVITSFTECVSKLVEERRILEAADEAADNRRSRSSASRYTEAEIVPEKRKPGPYSFRLSDNDDEDESSSNCGRSTQRRKYRHKRVDSSSSESDSECRVIKFPSHQTSNETEQVDLESNSSCPEHNATETTELPNNVGSFLEKKTTVIVKNLTDWITPSHILQDVKNAQLRSFEDAGIVRKRDRGAPYRYAYVNFLTHTSARRWIDIRKGRLVVGSQQFLMELSLKDWECPDCRVLNFGKSMVCCSCRNAKAQLLKTA